MNCPACSHELSQRVTGGITLDVCDGGCGGIWFDAFELQRVTRLEAGDMPLQVTTDPAVQVDAAARRGCPKCEGIVLMRHFFSPKRRVQVDECPGCGGYWLDAGEVAAIREERESVAPEKKSSKDFIARLAVQHLVKNQRGPA